MAAGGKMYVLGGFGGGKARGGVFEHDPAADRWTKKKPMARPVHHQAMVEYQGKIYVFGGFVFPLRRWMGAGRQRLGARPGRRLVESAGAAADETRFSRCRRGGRKDASLGAQPRLKARKNRPSTAVARHAF